MARSVLALVGLLLAGNLLILGSMWWARATTEVPDAPRIASLSNFQAVDDHLWRGAAPDEDALRALARHGVTTLVDLRAEHDLDLYPELLTSLGLRRVAIPMRDGQAPSADDVDRFLATVRDADGKVFVHCGAGVGRTGTMVASYLVRGGQANGLRAVRRNLAVGPPSLEQIAFAATLSRNGEVERPPAALTAVSRVLDAPRRIWVGLR